MDGWSGGKKAGVGSLRMTGLQDLVRVRPRALCSLFSPWGGGDDQPLALGDREELKNRTLSVGCVVVQACTSSYCP